MSFGRSTRKSASTSPSSLSHAKPISILRRIRAAASTSRQLNRTVELEQGLKLVKEWAPPPKIPTREARILPHPLQTPGPIRSVLQPLPSGAPATSPATNVLNPLPPTTPIQTSASSAPTIPSGRPLLVAARNSPSNVPQARPTTPLLADAILQSLVNRTSFTTPLLASANPSVLLGRLGCVLLKLPSGTRRPCTVRNAERRLPSGIRLQKLVRAAPRTVSGT
jgi:hypothetical protein